VVAIKQHESSQTKRLNPRRVDAAQHRYDLNAANCYRVLYCGRSARIICSISSMTLIKRRVRLSCPRRPHFHAVRTKDGWSLRHHVRWCDGLSLYARPYASFYSPSSSTDPAAIFNPRRRAAVIPALPRSICPMGCSCPMCLTRLRTPLDGSESV